MLNKEARQSQIISTISWRRNDLSTKDMKGIVFEKKNVSRENEMVYSWKINPLKLLFNEIISLESASVNVIWKCNERRVLLLIFYLRRWLATLFLSLCRCKHARFRKIERNVVREKNERKREREWESQEKKRSEKKNKRHEKRSSKKKNEKRTRRRSTGMPIRPIDQLIILTITLFLFD